MSAMKRTLSHRAVSVVAQCGDILYDARVERERRIAEALETHEVFARALRPQQARRFPAKVKPMAVRHHWLIRAARAAFVAFRRELAS
jgi:hypothetical protein